jgi:hypothetical protein
VRGAYASRFTNEASFAAPVSVSSSASIFIFTSGTARIIRIAETRSEAEASEYPSARWTYSNRLAYPRSA